MAFEDAEFALLTSSASSVRVGISPIKCGMARRTASGQPTSWARAYPESEWGDLRSGVLGVRGREHVVIDEIHVFVALAHVVEETSGPDHVEIGVGTVEIALFLCRLDRDSGDTANVFDVGHLVDVPRVWDILDIDPSAALESETPRLDHLFAECLGFNIGYFGKRIFDL